MTARDAKTGRTIALVTHNSLLLLGGQVVSRLLSFAYTILLARALGVESFGDFSLTFSIVLVADLASDWGLTRLIVRDLARSPEKIPSYLANLLPLKLGLILAGYLLMLLVLWLTGFRAEIVALCALAGLALFPHGMGALLDAVCHARQRMEWSSLACIALALVQAALGSLVLWAGGRLWAAIAVMLVANLTYFAVYLRAVRALGIPLVLKPSPEALRLLRQALPYAGVAVIGALSARAEVLVLGWVGSAAAVGVFGAALRFYEVASFLPIMIASAATPAMSRLHTESDGGLGGLYRWLALRTVLLSLPVAAVAALGAQFLIETLFPAEFAESTQALRLLFAAFPFAALGILNGSLMLASDHSGRTLSLAGLGVVLQFAFAASLAPTYGPTGAALALLLSQAAMGILSSVLVWRWYSLGTAGSGAGKSG